MATTDPTKALREAEAAAVAAIADIGDPTARYSAALELADWHRERARALLAHPPQPPAPARTPKRAARS